MDTQLKQIMTEKVETVGPGSTLQETANKMKNRNVGVIPVVDGKKVIGIITDRDITLRAVAPGLDVTKTKVSDLMTREPTFAYEDQTMYEACQLMEKNKVRRLIVLNRDGSLAGVVSLNDVTIKGKEPERSAQVLIRITPAA